MSRRFVSKRRHWPLCLALCMPLLASAHDNARRQTSPQPTTNQGPNVWPSARGARVSIDPVAPQSLKHSSGATGMVLGEDQMVYLVATIDSDGKLRMDDITGEKNALARVQAKPRKEAYDVR